MTLLDKMLLVDVKWRLVRIIEGTIRRVTVGVLVFIDMDGVVSNFDMHFKDIFGKPMDQLTDKQKNRFWDCECVAMRFFANAPVIDEGVLLVNKLRAHVDLSFLTSTGGEMQHTDIAKQKLDFLHQHGLKDIPVAFCHGTKSKATFAKPGTILVDDREKVVNAFRERGGVAHLFTRDNWLSIFDLIVNEFSGVLP